MKIYTMATPAERISEGIGGILASLVAFLFLARGVNWFWGIGVGVLVLVVMLGQTIRRVNVIRLYEDGTIEFEGLLGTVRLHVNDITCLAGVRTDKDYGMVEWSMRIWHRGDRTTVPFFYNAWDFIDEVRTMNPYVPVLGEWPMPYSGIPAVPDVQGPGSRVEVMARDAAMQDLSRGGPERPAG